LYRLDLTTRCAIQTIVPSTVRKCSLVCKANPKIAAWQQITFSWKGMDSFPRPSMRQPPLQRDPARRAGMSQTLLIKRLRKLIELGIVERKQAAGGWEYQVTKAGIAPGPNQPIVGEIYRPA
jgi:hypothetical protein